MGLPSLKKNETKTDFSKQLKKKFFNFLVAPVFTGRAGGVSLSSLMVPCLLWLSGTYIFKVDKLPLTFPFWSVPLQ